MFRVIVLCVLFAEIMQASWLDFWHATQAKEAYAKGDYARAASLYQRLDASQDAVLYDLGNSYYKQKEYDKAIKAYEKVKEPALMPQALHNTGNAYAMLHQNNQAIKAYEAALKLKEDADTRFNLELLKKNQEKEEKQQHNQQKPSKQSDDANRSNENLTSNPSSQNPSEQKQPEETQPKDAPANPSQKEEKAQSNSLMDANVSKTKEDKDIDQKTAQVAQEEDVKAPISEQEERQWDKILDQKSVNTLMLPLSPKGEQNANTKPW